jgi:aryl-alcohol dehydrogenase-like predicted oxidoreductase
MALNDYVTMGHSGLRVSPFCLGAMTFGEEWGWGSSVAESEAIISTFLERGGNFIDTANVYTKGHSEKIIGDCIGRHPARRDRVVIATKFFGSLYPGDPNGGGAGRKTIVASCEESLRRLQTDYIDLYQLHLPDPSTDVEETLSALSDLIHSGKVRAVGASHTPAPEIVEAQWVAERRGLERFRTEQVAYSILSRGIERELLPVTQRYGLGTLVWGPLAQGLLTGRVRRGQQNDLRRARFLKHLNDEHRLDVVEQLIPLAAEAGLPMTHLAMAFTIAHPGVTSALLGARTEQHLDDLLAGVDVALGDDLLDRIDRIVPPGSDVGALDQDYQSPALLQPGLRRRPVAERSAA